MKETTKVFDYFFPNTLWNTKDLNKTNVGTYVTRTKWFKCPWILRKTKPICDQEIFKTFRKLFLYLAQRIYAGVFQHYPKISAICYSTFVALAISRNY